MARPILYTFRRCPYAIRARLAIAVSGVDVEMREVDLRHKPPPMLACSPKGTVPVLQLADGTVIDESLEIMRWALALRDPMGWLDAGTGADSAEAHALIAHNDGPFKRDLDCYKYAGRFPQHPAAHYQAQAEAFLHDLESRLGHHAGLVSEQVGFADMAILPFIRQFAHVDKAWFYTAPYPHVIKWLDQQLASDLFTSVMQTPARP